VRHIRRIEGSTMKINGNAGYNPMMLAHGPKARSGESAQFAATQRAMDEAGASTESNETQGTFQMRRGQPPVDPSRILKHWGTSDAIADLNVDGIVDAQDLSMALSAVQDAPAGGGSNDSNDEWTMLTGGDLNGDGAVDAMDLAMKLNGAGDGSNDGNDEWTTLTGGDLNGDGAVDAMDLAMKLNGDSAGNRRTAAPSEDTLAAPMTGPIDLTGSVESVVGDGKPDQMIDRLANLLVKSFDADADGTLSSEDLPADSKVFAHFDRDASGTLEKSELVRGLNDEFKRYSESSASNQPGPFVKRWLETFSGMRPVPNYAGPMRLQELFLGPDSVSKASPLSSILSAKA
jgi:hypothetical protein